MTNLAEKYPEIQSVFDGESDGCIVTADNNGEINVKLF